MTTLEITDHALLRWMERVHGVDVETWRQLMQAELAASLEVYDGRGDPSAAGFVVCGQTVVTVVSPGCRTSRKPGKASLRLPRVA